MSFFVPACPDGSVVVVTSVIVFSINGKKLLSGDRAKILPARSLRSVVELWALRMRTMRVIFRRKASNLPHGMQRMQGDARQTFKKRGGGIVCDNFLNLLIFFPFCFVVGQRSERMFMGGFFPA